MGHGQLAVMCLIARYGPAYAGADTPLVLAPTPRTPAPPADRSGCILDRYSDVFGDLARYVSRTFLLAGMGDVSHEVGVAVFRHILLLLAEPDSFTLLVNAAGDRPAGKLRGLDGLSAADPARRSEDASTGRQGDRGPLPAGSRDGGPRR